MSMIVGIAKELELDRPIFMGCSMGGHVAPDLALHYPGMFRAVIAVQGGLATHDDEPFNAYMWHPRISNELKSALMFTMMSPRSPEALRRDVVGLRQSTRRCTKVTWCSTWESMISRNRRSTSTRPRHRCTSSVTVTDWSASPDKCKALADAIPGAQYQLMHNLGHSPDERGSEVVHGLPCSNPGRNRGVATGDHRMKCDGVLSFGARSRLL